MKIETLSTASLIPYARNAKKHDASQVAKLAGSIREFGFNNPVLIDKDNGIIAGHGRVLAAQSLGLETVPCIRLGHLSDTQRRAYILADNRLAEIGGGWDEEMLKLELADLAALDIDVAEIGFGAEDLAEMEMEDDAETSDADAEPQIDKAEELRAKWGVEPGQLWELGDHRLLCGDSTIPEHVAKLMQGEKAELLLTDPPYGIGIAANPVRQKHAKSDWDSKPVQPLPFINLCESAVVWGGNYFDLPTAKGFFIWDKKQPEEFTLAMCEMAWTNIDTPAKIFRKSVTSYSKQHPTQKPVELLAWCMQWSKGAVFDPFSGSGTTIIACEQLGRKCRAIEISPAYVAVAIQRWVDATGKEPKRLA
jgi:ParB-like chromosome segregation protein Spo0J